MFNLKRKLPIWIMGALVFMAAVVEVFFWDPAHSKFLLAQILSGQPSKMMVGIFGILFWDIALLAGWLYLMLGKDRLKPRLNWFWTPFGLLMAGWILMTFYGSTVLEEGHKLSLELFLTTSPEVWRAPAFGLLLAFYSLRSANRFWYFCWPLFWGGTVMYGAELPRLFGFGVVPWSPYLRPEEAGTFWHYWGWFFTDAWMVPVGLVAMYYIVRSRKSVLEKEGEKHAGFWAFLEGLGLWWVLLGRSLKKIFKK